MRGAQRHDRNGIDLDVLDEIDTRIALHPFTCGMRQHQIRLLAECAAAVTFPARSYIFRQGEFADRFYLIESGDVVLEAPSETGGKPLLIEKVGAGGLIGWSWMFPPHTWHFDARAVTRINALAFNGTILREYCEKDSALGFELFKRMSRVMIERLQRARARFLEDYSGRAGR